MPIAGLDHVTIKSARMAQTRAFFVEVLGLEEGWRPDLSSRGHWLYVKGRPILHLVTVEQPLPTDGGLDHFSFRVDDMDGMLARLDAHGVPYRHIYSANDLGRQAFLREPSGIQIELTWLKRGKD